MMKLSKVLLLSSLIAAAFIPAHSEVWTLDSCVSYATRHNVTIRQQQLNVNQGELAITEAKDRFLPSLDGSASQSFNFGRGLTAENTYANRNTSSTQWNIGLSLPLFQGMSEYSRLKIARLSLTQYLYEVEAAKENLSLNVIAQYLQVLYCKEVEKTAQSQLELSSFEVERQKALIDAGKVAEATLYDLESVAAQDRLQLITAQNDTRTALVNLTNLLQLKEMENFDVAPLEESDPPLPDPEAVYAAALGSNGSIQGARQGVVVANENIFYAKTGYIPTLSFNAGLGSSYYTVAGMPNQGFGAQMRNNFSTYLGFSLRIPIFDGFNTRNSVRRAKLQKLNADLQLEQRETDLYKEIRLAYYQASGARERFHTSSETLEKAQLSFDSTRERFNLGRATQADYEQAKNNLFRTQINRIQALYEFLIRNKILQFYSKGSL